MARAALRRRWLAWVALGVLVLLGVGTAVFWSDVQRTRLDPKVPFQTYRAPPAPDYGGPGAWALAPLNPAAPGAADPPADVFFVAPTLYDGGRHWNAPIDHPKADRLFREVAAPNYAGPFARVGRVFAPRYRQASLYTQLTLREDARDARRFAYADVAAAFRHYLAHWNQGRPLVIVGVEQGGLLAERLLAELVAPDPSLRSQLAAAYLIETVAPQQGSPLPPCTARGQTGCLAAWVSLRDGDGDSAARLLNRALVWSSDGDLRNLSGPAICFNPILGAATEQAAPVRLNQGAANATGLEWGARPAFLPRQVSARCKEGVLRVSVPKSGALSRTGGWADRRRAPPYNLFYLDLERDAAARVEALTES